MTSYDLKFRSVQKQPTASAAPSRSMWRSNHIILIIYTHNVYTDGKPRISSFHLYAVCEDPAIPINHGRFNMRETLTGVTFFAKFVPTLCC